MCVCFVGKYAGSHGVTGNTLYDDKLGYLTYGHELFHFNQTILPIWTWNELNNNPTGCMMWPGSDFEYRGRYCSHTQRLDMKMPLNDRVDKAIQWVTDKNKPANLVMFYVQEPDDTCHMYGCESPQV